MSSRVLAIDPGEVRLGLAISDPTRTVARPLKVLRHRSRRLDAQAILECAVEHQVGMIVVGLALDEDGQVGPQARRALRLAEMLRALGTTPVVTWDESGSTLAAQKPGAKDAMLDARAAAFVLQEFLDVRSQTT